jgi:F-type H+-transporting ATPase subunit g
MHSTYQQPVKRNIAVTREVLKHVYAAERLQPPTSLRRRPWDVWHAVRARSVGYWREVVRSGEYARLGVYALEVYGISR